MEAGENLICVYGIFLRPSSLIETSNQSLALIYLIENIM